MKNVTVFVVLAIAGYCVYLFASEPPRVAMPSPASALDAPLQSQMPKPTNSPDASAQPKQPNFADGVMFGVVAAKRNPDVNDLSLLTQIAYALWKQEHAGKKQ